MDSITTLLAANPYPGRGIVVGLTPDWQNAVITYFLMGRSRESRNRQLVEKDSVVYTKAFDERVVLDPSLLIYAALREAGQYTIVTNGDQTDTIYDYMNSGKSFEEALRTRSYEPDEPNFTPRISALISTDKRLSYRLAILRERKETTLRSFFEYAGVPGEGHMIHTYVGDGYPLPPFEGEPFTVGMMDDIEDWTQLMWRGLNEDNRVSLLTRYINLASGEAVTRIVNRHKS
jgi:IMP cyclohydrolase